MEEAQMKPFDGGGFDMPDRIKRCGHHPDSGCTCDQESNEEYLAGKFEDTGYPGLRSTEQVMSEVIQSNPGVPAWGPSTSQADEIIRKAQDPGMYAITHMNQKDAIDVNGRPVVWVERIAEDKITYEIQGIPHEQALRITRDILPKVLELYLSKAKDYPAWPDLGVKGEFVEIWRKTHKLKLSIWDGQEMVSEGAMEIVMDMIAHCLLALDCHERDR